MRYQLNPHFLFNSLNSISALIVTGRNKDAEAMTDKLSSFLRTSLNADPAELIPLDAELALTEEYLEIESVRFGERLDVTVDCAADACSALVPSFLVQPLVENAVKHGVARSRETTAIEIGATVEDGALVHHRRQLPRAMAAARSFAAPKAPASASPTSAHRLQAVFGERATLTAQAAGRPLRRHHLHPGSASRELT